MRRIIIRLEFLNHSHFSEKYWFLHSSECFLFESLVQGDAVIEYVAEISFLSRGHKVRRR